MLSRLRRLAQVLSIPPPLGTQWNIRDEPFFCEAVLYVITSSTIEGAVDGILIFPPEFNFADNSSGYWVVTMPEYSVAIWAKDKPWNAYCKHKGVERPHRNPNQTNQLTLNFPPQERHFLLLSSH